MRVYECPNCGARLVPTDNPEMMYCEYCGSHVDIVDHRTVVVEHIAPNPELPQSELKEESPSPEWEEQDQLPPLCPGRTYSRKTFCRYLAYCLGGLFGLSFLGSCMESFSAELEPASSISASSSSAASSSGARPIPDFHFDAVYTRVSPVEEDERYYFLIDYTNHYVVLVNVGKALAFIGTLHSGDLSTGLHASWYFGEYGSPTNRVMTYSAPDRDTEILCQEEDKILPFVKSSLSAGEKALDLCEVVYDCTESAF